MISLSGNFSGKSRDIGIELMRQKLLHSETFCVIFSDIAKTKKK